MTPFLSQNEKPFAVAAGFDGNDWVTGNQGTVIAIPRRGGAPGVVRLQEPIAEDLATDPTGTYVVTTAALYRIKADADGAPRVVWRLPIPTGLPDTNAGRIHPGSGTPPVIVPGGWVAVTDGEDPPRILVAHTRGPEEARLACATKVFASTHGSIEAHLVVAGHSIVAANAYGYPNPTATEGGRTTTGGITQVQVTPRGCRTVWRSSVVSPSAQMVVSRRTGLLYTLEKPKGFPDAWNLAALDWRTGKLRFEALAGEGLGYNSEGGALALGADGAAYAGTFGGVVRFKDAG
jgi:hypothetical protein